MFCLWIYIIITKTTWFAFHVLKYTLWYSADAIFNCLESSKNSTLKINWRAVSSPSPTLPGIYFSTVFFYFALCLFNTISNHPITFADYFRMVTQRLDKIQTYSITSSNALQKPLSQGDSNSSENSSISFINAKFWIIAH